MSYGQAGIAMQAEESYAKDEYQVVSSKKVKKPGFFKRWLFDSLKEVAKAEQQTNQLNESIKVRRGTSTIAGSADIDLNKERAIRFNVYIANGGRVVETSRYDRLKDRHTNGLYIISDQQDFGREIDKIIVMEGLK